MPEEYCVVAESTLVSLFSMLRGPGGLDARGSVIMVEETIHNAIERFQHLESKGGTK